MKDVLHMESRAKRVEAVIEKLNILTTSVAKFPPPPPFEKHWS